MNIRRRGTVLILTMVIVFMLAAMVLSLGRQVRVQALASANDLAAQKADAAERGAEQYVVSLLTTYRDTIPTMLETDFSAVPVGDAYFWIVRPTYGDSSTPAWGLTDENGKLDLNVVKQAQLELLPGMTPELAAAIVAWRGTGTTTTTATDTTTGETTTPPPSAAGGATKNAAFETVDELSLVPGMTREILYGAPPADPTTASDAEADWAQTHGLFDYFTVWSLQPNTAEDGTARISLTANDNRDQRSETLVKFLPEQTRANEIVNGMYTVGRRGREQAKPLTGMFQLAVEANLKAEEFALIEDYFTRDAQATALIGRVNVNTAPRDVLRTLNNIPEEDVDKMLSARAEGVSKYPNSLAWVLDAMSGRADVLDTYVTARGRHFSADIVAASSNGRGFRHVRVVLDTTTTPARIVYRRDLTDRGWPMEQAILDQLKAGTFAGNSALGKATSVAAGAG